MSQRKSRRHWTLLALLAPCALVLCVPGVWAQADDPGLAQLRAAVIEAQKSSADPLSAALKRFAAPGPDLRSFTFTPDKQLQKPEDVTDEEWRDLLKLNPKLGVEEATAHSAEQEAVSLGEMEGIASYAFFDLDGDGWRDLLLTTVNQGALQCENTYALRRSPSGIQTKNPDDYDVCYRGGPELKWLRIGQSLYVAKLISSLAVDALTLQRPFASESGLLSVRYRYTLAAHPKVSRTLRRAINLALAKADASSQENPQDSPCFKDFKAAETVASGRFDDLPGLCVYVGDRFFFPVRSGRTCLPGALTGQPGSDPKTGEMDAYISVGNIDLVTEELEGDCYETPEKVITGVRIMRSVERID